MSDFQVLMICGFGFSSIVAIAVPLNTFAEALKIKWDSCDYDEIKPGPDAFTPVGED